MIASTFFIRPTPPLRFAPLTTSPSPGQRGRVFLLHRAKGFREQRSKFVQYARSVGKMKTWMPEE
jgi:hypothetical protein